MAHEEHEGHEHGHGEHEHGHEHGPGGHDHGHEHGEHGHGGQGHEHGHEGHGHEGEHQHPHGAGHVHPHAPGGEAHEHPGLRAEPLAEGAASGRVIFLDAFSGLAGDMIIATLLDLGVPLLAVERALSALPLENYHVHRGHAHRSGIVATTFDVHLDAAQPERTYRSIDDMLAAAPLPEAVKALARAIFRRLGEAEAAVHAMPLDAVHFHEVGAVDAIVDVVGAAACFVYLGGEVVCSPLPMGRGFVKARHGILPLPAPATVSCLRGVPTYPVDLEAELVTPTGAAIVATVARRFERWPSFAPERVGWGSGTRTLPDRPNLLRSVIGAPTVVAKAAEGTHVVLEANVDDLTGEMAGHVIERLLAAGALDAWAAPVTMKKGRPGLVLSALAEAAAEGTVAAVLLRESTSLGVRHRPVTRTERPRRMLTVDTPFGPIPVKVSEGGFGPPVVKPEFDACALAAAEHGVPVRSVITAALARGEELVNLGRG
jgi:pyridinium-3,5-bisthiocarboxylic acid mononucleotide nickel chelatase